MAVLYVEEFVAQGMDPNGRSIAIGMQPNNAAQTVAISSSSAATTNAFKNNTNLVRLHTDAICSVAFATSPTATATTARMAANQTEYFAVTPGSGLKVAVITNT